MEALLKTSAQGGDNVAYLEYLYEAYLKDPNSVEPHWRHYFESLSPVKGSAAGADLSHESVREFFYNYVQGKKIAPGVGLLSTSANLANAPANYKQACVDSLIRDYRRFGHFAARLDPLGSVPAAAPELALEYHGLSEADYDTNFQAHTIAGENLVSLKTLHHKLQEIYSGSIGFEYSHIRSPDEVNWLQKNIEGGLRDFASSQEEQRQALDWLIAAEAMEAFLGRKYVGQKRFSLQGGDSLIPLLHTIINGASSHAVEEMVLGMAHRGRLNVLFNIMGLSAEELCKEFEGKIDYGMTSGDVKYHMGFSSDIITDEDTSRSLHLSLAFNPSHLEAINGVVMGSVKARQQQRQDTDQNAVMGVLIHGDASITGQGCVMEILNMAYTPAYTIGGTLHIVVNNQIGFTTNPSDSRSTYYCTDFVKAIEAPVFHVNGDDPDAVLLAGRLALQYRLRFKKDVVIDLVCYRRHGHNEADEPIATQPLMYKNVREHRAPWEAYAKQLLQAGVCTQADVDKKWQHYEDVLTQGGSVARCVENGLKEKYLDRWTPYIEQSWRAPCVTAVDRAELEQLAEKIVTLPEGFSLQRQVAKMMESRKKMGKGELPVDWGYAETLAYASLLNKGYGVRLVGQDSCRGTFAHRHAVLHDQATGKSYTPLNHLGESAAEFQAYNSVLSEEAALAFEYGYAATSPGSLVIWEAQFGDFANGAQIIIDQFISSAWQKWRRLCGLVLFLPHGHEGMGPEHSSARLERYLQLTAQDNIQVCVPSTPAQVFHMLRRQMLRPFRKPLIVMTPKKALRHKLAISDFSEFSEGQFSLIIPEIDKAIIPKKVTRVVLCSGKVFYDLILKRRECKLDDVAIIRIEQLYPFPYEELTQELQRYTKAKQVIWCQEEPENQGTWHSKRHCMETCLAKGQKLRYAGRTLFAAPAAGYPFLHNKQQVALVNDALGLESTNQES